MNKYGKFCEVYGKTLRNKLLEYILEMGRLDFAVGGLAEEINISRPKAYQLITELEDEGIIKKTRIVGKTQLYSLNHENVKVKLLKKSFDECLRLVVDENPFNEWIDFAKKHTLSKEILNELKNLIPN